MKTAVKKIIEKHRYSSVVKAWKKRHAQVFRLHPHLLQNTGKQILADHVGYWKQLKMKFSTETFRICHQLSGVKDKRIVPEELYQGYIEPRLNQPAVSDFFSHKSFYHHWHGSGIFPATYFHKIDGHYYNDQWEVVGIEDVVEWIKTSPHQFVVKPNFGSYGGKGVQFVTQQTEGLETLLSGDPGWVLQERIRQHGVLAVFHPQSLNTVRAHLYRSLESGAFVFLHGALRMGRDGGLDNVSDGGLVSFIRKDGKLHGHALDKYGDRLEVHPNSGKSFDMTLPNYDELKGVALKVARKIFYTRVIGLDMCYDADGKWRVIEVNTQAQSIRFAQYAGIPFFGNYTDEVKNRAGCLV
ncbi:sugar-transfer associated ATP-grasp domain-containing protein [Negadavirga shengliensis]|uniref:Sugar-transfer associated ATP-grasp domain-containing protein n=1 Tax=Negadavirga shengliensis TaxID=1389218 RepID=A0ABV9SYY8_9BACT